MLKNLGREISSESSHQSIELLKPGVYRHNNNKNDQELLK